MNKKEKIGAVLEGRSSEIPVTIHGWGLYKFKMAGIINGYENEAKAWELNGEALADVEASFYERFKPDTFHLGCGKSVLPGDQKKEKYIRELEGEVRMLEDKKIIDEYINAIYVSEEEILASKMYSHVEALSRRYGKEAFITLNEGNPFADALDPHGLLGFEDGLIDLIEKPEMTAYLLFRLYEIRLEKIKALKKCGADGYIGSETYCSADLISPQIFHDLVSPAQRHFYTRTKEIGLYSICYFLGNLFPMLEDIKNLGIDVLLSESRNKGFVINIEKLYEQADGAFTLYGNLNSVEILLNGKEPDVRRETRRQTGFCNRGKFIMANDCPLSFNTPEENIDAMINETRTL